MDRHGSGLFLALLACLIRRGVHALQVELQLPGDDRLACTIVIRGWRTVGGFGRRWGRSGARHSSFIRRCPLGARFGSARNEPLCQPGQTARHERDRSGRESVREFEIAGEPRQVHELVGEEQWFDLTSGGQTDGVAGIVVAVAVAFLHVAHLAMPDEVGAPGCRLPVGGGENEFASSQRGQGHRHVLAVDLLELGKGMDAGNDRAAEIAGGLEPFFQRGKAVECPQFIDQEPEPQVRRALQCHQRVHGRVEPQGEQLRTDRHVDIARREEQDRSRSGNAAGPVPYREARAVVGQQLQRLGIGIEHGPDRLRHARCFGSGQRVGHGAAHELVDLRKIGRHQPGCERVVGGLTGTLEMQAHFDKEHASGEYPELLRAAAIVRNERFGGSVEFALAGAVMEYAPGRTAGIERVQNDVALGVVKGLDEGPGEVEDHRALPTHPGLAEELAKGHGLAGASCADQHRMALLKAPRPGHASEMSRAVKACLFGRCSACQPPFPAERGVQFAGTFRAVVPVDFCLELVKGDKHRAALVLALLRLAAEPFGEPPKGDEGRDEDKPRKAHAAPYGNPERSYGLAHRRKVANDSEWQTDSASTGELELHQLAGIKLHEGVARSIEMHPRQVDLVIGKRRGHLPIGEPCGDHESHQQGAFEAGREHEAEVAEELAAAREIEEITLHRCLPRVRRR